VTEEEEQLVKRITEGFLEQARHTIAKLGEAEGQLVVQQSLMAYAWKPAEGDEIPADGPFAGLTPSQRESVAKAATDVLAVIQAETSRPRK